MDDEQEDFVLVSDYLDNGNAAAIDRLVSKYGRSLMSYLVATTRNHADAEEIFQDAWLSVIRNAHRFKGGSFKAWLTTIARNSMIDRVRRRKPVTSLDVEIEENCTLKDIIADNKAADPFAGMMAEDTKKRIRAAVSLLPEQQREVFLLRTEQELSFAEISKALAIPLNTALGRMHYAVARLRKELADIWTT